MRPILAAAAFAVGVGAAAADAHADLLSLRVEGHLGGGGGAGIAGANQDNAFANTARGGVYGALVGLEVLFVEGWIEHHQYRTDELLGTWTQFMVGLDLDFEKREEYPRPPGSTAPVQHGKQTGYFELGIGAGFGVSTDEQVEPPLDASEVTHRGFIVEGRVSAGFVVAKVIGIGITVPVSAGYFIASGFANDAGNHYWSVQAAALLVVRGKLKIK
jgi:hypothetical protein